MNINHQRRINIHVVLQCKLFLQKATILIIFIKNYLEFKYLFTPIVINYEILPDTFQQLPRTIILSIQTSLTFKFHHDFEKKKISSRALFSTPGMSLGASGRSSALHGVPGRSRAHFSWTEIKAGTKSRHCLYEEKCYVRYDCRIKTMFCSSLSPGSCLIYVICVSLRIMVSNTYCVVFLFCLSSSCIVCAQCCQYLWIVHS